MLKRLFVAMLALCMTSAMTAQNRYSLRGQLTDGKGDPLPFSNAVILNTTDSAFVCGTTSDVEGVFAFDKVAGSSAFCEGIGSFGIAAEEVSPPNSGTMTGSM